MLKILFTDFDGVLHPCNAGSFIYLDRYQDFLRKHPGVRVVLSTTWRLDHPWAFLMAMFAPDIQARMLGSTPELPEKLAYSREMECREWLMRNGHTKTPWIALDDDASLFTPGCNSLVLCNTIKGLRTEQLNEIEHKLQLRN